MRIVNLTSFDIIIGKEGENKKFEELRTFPKATDDKIVRVKSERIACEPIGGVAVSAIRLLEVENLPEPQEGVRYIVSMPVAQFAKDRQDLLCSYSERGFLDGNRVLGVLGLVRYEPIEMKPKQEVSTSLIFKRFVGLTFRDTFIGTQSDDKKFHPIKTIPKTTAVAKLESVATEQEAIDGIRLFSIRFSGIKDLPEEEEGVIYIVPLPVAQACDRTDVYAADTENAIRDTTTGAMLGFPGLVRYLT